MDLVIYGKSACPSFRVKNGKAYRIADGELMPDQKPGLPFAKNVFGVPCVSGGSFINYCDLQYQEGTKFVFGVYEPDSLPRKLKSMVDGGPRRIANRIKKAYPNAKLIGYSKERRQLYSKSSTRFLRACDAIALPYENEVRDTIERRCKKRVHSLPYPYPVDQIRETFRDIVPDERAMFLASSKSRNYPHALSVANRICQKFGLNLVIPQRKMGWDAWLGQIASCRFCMDLDPTPNIGQVAIECAILDRVLLGGMTDAARALYPETATLDPSRIEGFVGGLLKGEFTLSSIVERARKRHSSEEFLKQVALRF